MKRVILLAACAALCGCSAVAHYPIVASVPTVLTPPCKAAAQASHIGLTVSGYPPSTDALTNLESETGVQPGFVLWYPVFGAAFDASAACYAAEHGAVPLMQIDPNHTSLADIAGGTYDSYLRTYAQNVGAFHAPLILSFGHEMNGDWYRWGWKHTPAATFVAAWRHIVAVFRQGKATNVTWLWTVNEYNVPTGPGNTVADPAAWWPGSAYVDMVGVDGYYRSPRQTFAKVFGNTLRVVKTYDKPVLLAEVGVAPEADAAAQVTDLFAGAKAAGVAGLVWFDAKGSRDYRLENRPAVLAAFRQAAARYS